MVEVLIAVAIFSLLAIAIISTSLMTQRVGRAARNNILATKLVEEGIEKARVMRDRKGTDGIPFVDQSTLGHCVALLESSNGDPEVWYFSHDSHIPFHTPYKFVCTDPNEYSVNEEIIFLEDTNFYRRFSIKKVQASDSQRKLITVYISWEDTRGWKTVTSQTILGPGLEE